MKAERFWGKIVPIVVSVEWCFYDLRLGGEENIGVVKDTEAKYDNKPRDHRSLGEDESGGQVSNVLDGPDSYYHRDS